MISKIASTCWKTMQCLNRCCPENLDIALKQNSNSTANIFVNYCSLCSSYWEPLSHAWWIHRSIIAAMAVFLFLFQPDLCPCLSVSVTRMDQLQESLADAKVSAHQQCVYNRSLAKKSWFSIPSCTSTWRTMVRPCCVTMWSYHGWYMTVYHCISWYSVTWYTMW